MGNTSSCRSFKWYWQPDGHFLEIVSLTHSYRSVDTKKNRTYPIVVCSSVSLFRYLAHYMKATDEVSQSDLLSDAIQLSRKKPSELKEALL